MIEGFIGLLDDLVEEHGSAVALIARKLMQDSLESSAGGDTIVVVVRTRLRSSRWCIASARSRDSGKTGDSFVSGCEGAIVRGRRAS